MSEKHAIFLDIDNTFTAGSEVPSEENISAVRRVREMGHLVFLNTGRSYGFIPETVLKSTEFDGVLAGNGSFIKFGEEIIKADRMSVEVLKKQSEYFLKNRLPVIFEGEKDTLYICSDRHLPTWLEVADPDDFDEKYAEVPITKVTVLGHLNNEGRKLVGEDMRLIEFPTYAEAVIDGNDKAKGIQIIMDKTGIDRAHCIAMGDSLNDIEMVGFCGIGVAMGNACDELKAIADFVSVPANEGGVAKALEHFLL